MLLRGVGVDTLPIGRHPLAPIKATILLRGPIALIAPSLKISLGALHNERAPWSKAAAVPARIESAAPLPFGSGAGVADACGDRADWMCHVSWATSESMRRVMREVMPP